MKKNKTNQWIGAIVGGVMVSLAWPGVSLAHPGHGRVADPVAHWMLEPLHLLPLLLLAVGTLWWLRSAYRSRISG